MPSNDLAEILEATPRRRVDFDLTRVNIGQLTVLELLDAADASGVDFDEFRTALDDPARQGRLMYAIAWVIMRRQEKSLTFDDVCEFDLIVTGQPDEEDAKKSKAKAAKVVAIASLTGVSPEVAGQMTIDEVAAVSDLHQVRNRRMRRAARRK